MNWTKESRELMNKLEFEIPAGYFDTRKWFFSFMLCLSPSLVKCHKFGSILDDTQYFLSVDIFAIGIRRILTHI